MDDERLLQRFEELTVRAEDPRYTELRKRMPHIVTELGRPHVTRQLLWEEYRSECPDGYGHSQFCYHLQMYLGDSELSMHIEHEPGRRVFVDFAGDRPVLTDANGQERTVATTREARIPVRVAGLVRNGWQLSPEYSLRGVHAPGRPGQGDIGARYESAREKGVSGMKEIPQFKNEEEERQFWAEHDSTEYVDWSNATLASQPELATMLEYSHFEALRARIRLSHTLVPMSLEETIGYIDHGLKIVNYKGSLFSDTAKMEIFRRTGGIARAINSLCYRAILDGAIEQKQVIDTADVLDDAG